MAKLIFDIETVGEDFETLDKTTQEVLTRWIKKESGNDAEYRISLEDLKSGMGFSPLTGQIVALGVLDAEKNKGGVYFQSPGVKTEGIEEDGIKFEPMNEKEILEKFWSIAEKYTEFIDFNGKSFDVPFIMIRSAIHKVRPAKNLMSNRYLGSQKFDAKHVDLLDELTYYGAVRRKGGLHLWCRAFGIKSPKSEGVTGDDVGRLFREKKFLDIARYNVRDLYATKKLYEYWDKYIRF